MRTQLSAQDSASRMVSAFIDDTRLIGVCGETALTNAKSSFITMIQVYEYWISHNLSKAFESLFGSVTCLPGCFTMYRIRAADTGKPLFVSREIVENYCDYPSRHSPYEEPPSPRRGSLLDDASDQISFEIQDEVYSVTPTHGQLLLIPGKSSCLSVAAGSTRLFTISSNLCPWPSSVVSAASVCDSSSLSISFSTLVQPVTVAYIVYLIVEVALRTTIIPLTAFILLGAIYGLQAIIFILRRKWEMIGWMILYVCAIPVFSFALPLYSFWHMDDFSWGNTRVVTGEKGRKIVITDEGKFDPASIPHKKWEDYQAELWDAQTTRDDRSEISGYSYGTKSYHATQSMHDYPPSRPLSQMGYPYGNQPAPAYSSRLSLVAFRDGSPSQFRTIWQPSFR